MEKSKPIFVIQDLDILLFKMTELSDFIVLKNGHLKSVEPIGNTGI